MTKDIDFLPVYPIEVYLEWMSEQNENTVKLNSDMWNNLHRKIVAETYETKKDVIQEQGFSLDLLESFESFQLVSYVIHAYHRMIDTIVKQEIEEMTAMK
jgi:hypothetical protein